MHTLNATQAAMLGLFGNESLTGHDIVEIADNTMKPYWSMTRSQVYRELSSMEEMGLIEKDNLVRPPLRNRQFYKVTKLGRTTFSNWLTSPIPETLIRNHLAVRLVFANGMSKADLAELVKTALADAKRELIRIRNTRKRADDLGLKWDSTVLRLSEMQQQALIKWIAEIKQST